MGKRSSKHTTKQREAISIKDEAAAPEPLKPWRELCDSDNKKAEDKLRSNIKQNNSTDFKITLVGNSGAGKSSFINSAFSISRRRIADVVRVKGEAVSGIGTFSFDGERAGPDDLFPSVVFLDTMGFSRSDGNKCNGISEEDLKRVCNGEIRIGHKIFQGLQFLPNVITYAMIQPKTLRISLKVGSSNGS
ncbi:uncharacterized protein LOC128241686 isoform X7 [Mya arenaria]|uniref:uncharacterized protein LOC128241686 isoform X7 n=1 Tax=Mya arenaria TaxID=6604 RepID=UPI0022DFE26A|nr:uncharacterized protein LOC128241686 isoform X7 [Mya arenaria]